MACAFLGCTADKQVEKESDEANEPTENLESRIKRHVESALSIPSTENYTLEIWKENLDANAKVDAIITVNRLAFAMEEASKANNTAQRASIGFMGNHNYIFYYDGELDKISPQIAVPSSPKRKLTISFEHITSEKYKDILIDYRILHASYKAFYTIKNHLPNRIFEWKNFDGLTEQTTESFLFKYEKGSYSEAKDILILEGSFMQPAAQADPYQFDPEIKPTDKLLYRFFYHPETGKYMTKK